MHLVHEEKVRTHCKFDEGKLHEALINREHYGGKTIGSHIHNHKGEPTTAAVESDVADPNNNKTYAFSKIRNSNIGLIGSEYGTEESTLKVKANHDTINGLSNRGAHIPPTCH